MTVAPALSLTVNESYVGVPAFISDGSLLKSTLKARAESVVTGALFVAALFVVTATFEFLAVSVCAALLQPDSHIALKKKRDNS